MKLTGNRLVRPGEEDNAAISEVSTNEDKERQIIVTLRNSWLCCYKVNVKVVQSL